MTILNINTIEQDTIRHRLLDELADGQWHPLYKMQQRIDRGSTPAKAFKQELADELDVLVEEGWLHAGNNNSYRFRTENLEGWRAYSTTPSIHENKYKPRYFGGVIEDDGWEQAPLKTFGLVHFRADQNLPRKLIYSVVGGKISRIQLEDGLFRVFSPDGETVLKQITQLKQDYPNYHISSIRLERNLTRRELDDLPPRYVQDLVRYYGQFAKLLLRPYMTSVIKHIPDQDDRQQQIYLWVLEAIQRYDASTSIPFAAYLGSSLSNWVFNLNRKANGRAAADAELKYARAIADLRTENSREPSAEEIATYLSEDIETVRKEQALISTVRNLRNAATLDNDENEIQLPSEERVEEEIERRHTNTLLSAAVIAATRQQIMTTKDTGLHLDHLVAVYFTTWGAPETTPRRVKSWLRTEATQEKLATVLEHCRGTILAAQNGETE